MGLEKDWLSFGSTSVNIAALSTHDGYGVPTYAAGSTYDAIIQPTRRLISRPDGRQEVSTHLIFVLSTSATVGLQDRVTIPVSSEQPRLLGVEHVSDDKGQHHVELLVG